MKKKIKNERQKIFSSSSGKTYTVPGLEKGILNITLSARPDTQKYSNKSSTLIHNRVQQSACFDSTKIKPFNAAFSEIYLF
jgi:hypothetical protein